MALFTVLKALVDDNINTNGIQYITGAIHNDVMNELIDAVGAAQVYVNPATTDNPGTPANNRAYIALPGTYTNFGNLTVTAPLGVLKWDGTSWTVTQLPIPSPYGLTRAVTSAVLTIGTPYTTVNITQSNGGFTAYAGHWVKIIDPRTGNFDFVQLTADLIPADTSITFDSRTMVRTLGIGSIVDVFPTIGMRDWRAIPIAGAGLNYVDVDSSWLLPPVECVQGIVYAEYIEVIVGSYICQYDASPSEDWHYNLNATTRTRIEFLNNFVGGEIVRVRVRQPAVLELYTP